MINQVKTLNDPLVYDALKNGGVVVARTDTLYGVLAKASDEQAVKRVYQLKNRHPDKSPIVLISHLSQIYDAITPEIRRVCLKCWPGATSLIIPSNKAPVWLRRDNASVAYRLPANEQICQLIAATGPLIAPSANPESLTPAMNIEQAYQYFGDAVDVYVDGGEVENTQPSDLFKLSNTGDIEQLR